MKEKRANPGFVLFFRALFFFYGIFGFFAFADYLYFRPGFLYRRGNNDLLLGIFPGFLFLASRKISISHINPPFLSIFP
jgi:hypothetical protein